MGSVQEVLDRLGCTVPEGYQPIEVLGEGGCAVVLRARPHGSQVDVALKIAQKGMEGQIKNERDLLNDLSGVRGVIRLLSKPADEDGYLVSEVLQGRPLYVYLASGAITLSQALLLIAKIAIVLADIHEQGVVHRDLKPGNIFVGRTHDPVLLDFGIAGRIGKRISELGHEVSGSPAYIAPEVLLHDSELTPAQDVYALGVLLYKVCEGRVPFFDPNFRYVLAQKLVIDAPPISSEYPERLRYLVKACLEKEPCRRLSDTRAFVCTLFEAIADLGALGGEPIRRVERPRLLGGVSETLVDVR